MIWPMVAAAGVASSNAASPAAEPPPMKRPNADRPDRLQYDQPRDVSSGRTERHPHADFPGALFDEVRQHAEQARQRQRQGQPAEDDRQPERDLQEVGLHPGQRPHGHHLAGHVGIDRGQSIEERLPCQFGIAVDARDERRLGHRGTRRHVDDGLFEVVRSGTRRRLGRPRPP